jgi:predicted RNase H-like HicB family nuclease
MLRPLQRKARTLERPIRQRALKSAKNSFGSRAMLRYKGTMVLRIATEREVDGRWIAEVVDLPGVMVYGVDRESAIARVKELARRVIEDRREHGEPAPEAVFDLV